jgi:hypothetical protein
MSKINVVEFQPKGVAGSNPAYRANLPALSLMPWTGLFVSTQSPQIRSGGSLTM